MVSRTSLVEAAPAVRRGLLWMLGATAAIVVMNSCAKLLREDGFSTAEIIFYRTAPGLLWIWLELRRRGRSLRPVRTDLVVARSLFGVAAMAANFYTVRMLALVQNQVLHLLQPVFVAMIAPLVLRERLHRMTFVALVFGATGALLVLAPQGDLSTLPLVPALIGIGGALSSALAHVTIRKTSATEAPEVVVFHFALLASVLGLLWAISSGELQLAHLASTWHLALVAGTAFFGTLGQLLMTRAYGQAPASMIAMVAYAAIPLSLSLDLLLWSVPVGLISLVCAVLMIAAGYVLSRTPANQVGHP
jgi:drug/metabolite transporter (DMT)-like permease